MLKSTCKMMGLVLLSFGTVGIVLSIFYESTALTFIGLSLTFWGCLFLLVLPGKYAKSEVVDHMSSSSLAAINQIIADLNPEGKPVYIPVPKGFYLPYRIGLEKEFIYIPEKNVNIETAIEQAFTRTPKGLRITPPGLGLADLVEKKSKLDLSDIDLNSLMEVLPPIVTQDLEIAGNLRIEIEGNIIHTEIKKPVCENLCKEATRLEKMCPHIGCPLSSSIACILTRVTKKPVIIERCSIKNSNIETLYRVL